MKKMVWLEKYHSVWIQTDKKVNPPITSAYAIFLIFFFLFLLSDQTETQIKSPYLSPSNSIYHLYLSANTVSHIYSRLSLFIICISPTIPVYFNLPSVPLLFLLPPPWQRLVAFAKPTIYSNIDRDAIVFQFLQKRRRKKTRNLSSFGGLSEPILSDFNITQSKTLESFWWLP